MYRQHTVLFADAPTVSERISPKWITHFNDPHVDDKLMLQINAYFDKIIIFGNKDDFFWDSRGPQKPTQNNFKRILAHKPVNYI